MLYEVITLQKPVLWINVLLAFCIITAMYSTYGYMADFLKSVTKMNGKEISMMLFLFGTVITSYSIHYTKLYEYGLDRCM